MAEVAADGSGASSFLSADSAGNALIIDRCRRLS
jgi:hypothetical protein